MKLYLDTSTPETILKLNDKEYRYAFTNDLAEKLLSFIQDNLAENNKSFSDITEITFMSTAALPIYQPPVNSFYY